MKKLLLLLLLPTTLWAAPIKPIPDAPQKKDIASINAFKRYIKATIAYLDLPDDNVEHSLVDEFNALTLSGLLQRDKKTLIQKNYYGKKVNFYYFNKQGKPTGNIYTIIKSSNQHSKRFILRQLKKVYVAIIQHQRIVDIEPFPKLTGFGFYGPEIECTDNNRFADCLFTSKNVKLDTK